MSVIKILPQLYEATVRPRSTIKNPGGPPVPPITSLARTLQNLTWQSFDHSQTLCLGESKSTEIVYKKDTFERTLLRSCRLEEWTHIRAKLVEHAKSNKSFVLTYGSFLHGGRMFVASELMDMSLADIIDCTISMSEVHVSTVLNKVTEAICSLDSSNEASGFDYGNLQAINVFITRSGDIKLDSFGPNVTPVASQDLDASVSCRDIGRLAIHMISRSPEAPKMRQKSLSDRTSEIGLDMQFEPTAPFVDFLQACGTLTDMRKLHEHPFLRDALGSSLNPLVDNAERLMFRTCSPKTKT